MVLSENCGYIKPTYCSLFYRLTLPALSGRGFLAASQGINVNAIAPGYMATDNTAAPRADEQHNAEILGRIPAKRWGNPDDLAGPVVFLASSASDYINGYTLAIDGGWLAR